MSKIHKKTGNSCIICDEEIVKNKIKLHSSRRQSHNLCTDCGIGYLGPEIKKILFNMRMNIKTNFIKCPGTYHCESRNKCKSIVAIDIIEAPELPFSLDLWRIKHMLHNRNVFICNNLECKNIIEMDDIYNIHMECNLCKTSWCKSCLISPYHEDYSCYEKKIENDTSPNGKYILEMKEQGNLKLCPRCRSPTMKVDGCNKMICSICNIKWCWLCNTINIDYDHYNEHNESRCAGKLWV